MPELPEVEVARENLSRWTARRVIERAEAKATRVLRPGNPKSLDQLAGARVTSIERIGKALLWRVKNDGAPIGIYSHLGMTGKWLRRAQRDQSPPLRSSRVRLHLDDGQVLHYTDPRMFGRFVVVPGARFDQLKEVSQLGPDPLRQGIDTRRLHDALSRTRRPIKVVLLDQTLLAGVGNIQANECLFRAAIDPRRPANALSLKETEKIAKGVIASIKATLDFFHKEGVTHDQAEITYVEEGGENWFFVYDKEGERCPRCHKANIDKITLGGRGTFHCPHCQK